jgi:hypothetical protein
MAGIETFRVCTGGHRIDDVAIYCPTCGRLVLVRAEPSDRTARDLQLMVLTVATLGAGLLFRLTNQVWPAYLYLGLALTALYAVVFSRGYRTLSAAAGGLGLITVGWLVWSLISRETHVPSSVSHVLYALPAVVWLLSLAAVLLVHRWALDVVKEPGTYVLAVGVFTLGFWGVWAALLQGDLVSEEVYNAAVVLSYFAPLAFIPLIRKWRPYQDNQGNLIIWGAIVVVYLMAADFVLRALGYVLGQLFPHILGLAALPPFQVKLSYTYARAALTVAVLGIILLTALIDSIVVVSQRFEKPEHVNTERTGDIPLPGSAESAAPASSTRVGSRQSRNAFGRHAVEGAASTAEESSVFAVEVAKDFLDKFSGFARLINLVIPVIVYTALSILFILMLDVFREYNIYGVFTGATAIWGMSVLTIFLALVGFAVAVNFAPWAYKEAAVKADGSADTTGGASQPDASTGPTTDHGAWRSEDRLRGRNWGPIVNGSAVLLAGFYVLVSIASVVLLAVWLTLWASRHSTRLFTPGPVYLINLGFVAAVVGALLALGVVIDWARRRGRSTAGRSPSGRRPVPVRRWVARAARYVLPLTLALLAITAMVFGTGPMIQAVSFVARSHDAADDTTLRAVVPVGIVDRCTQDHLILTTTRADLNCELGGGLGVVTYHLFNTADEMNQVYATVLNGRRHDPATGGCGAPSGSRSYMHGQVGCYSKGGTAWLVWTDDRFAVLSLAYRSNGDLAGLHAYWSAGAMGPVVR